MADPFRDEWDRKAHDCICLYRYGSIGGSVNSADVKRIGDYLRGGPFRPAVPALVLPPIPRAPVALPPIPRI